LSNCAYVTPNYKPPETLAHNLQSQINPLLDRYTHIGIIDRDVTVPAEFYELHHVHESEIIGVHVRPSSMIIRLWESTYHIRFNERVRDCAVIYRTDFLKRVGGIPDSPTPGSILLKEARTVEIAPITVIHHQSFDLRHSIKIQVRDGLSRAEMKYSFSKTILHGIFRLRPLVLLSFLYYRVYGSPEEKDREHPHLLET
jgi:hypothetical protein